MGELLGVASGETHRAPPACAAADTLRAAASSTSTSPTLSPSCSTLHSRGGPAKRN